MTSKMQPAADYWTIDFKMTSKVQPAADYWTTDVKDYWTTDRENPGTRLCYLTKSEMAASLSEEIFWVNNKAITEFCFRRIWRILQISEGFIHLGLRTRWMDNTFLHLQNSSYPSPPYSIIAKYILYDELKHTEYWTRYFIYLPRRHPSANCSCITVR